MVSLRLHRLSPALMALFVLPAVLSVPAHAASVSEEPASPAATTPSPQPAPQAAAAAIPPPTPIAAPPPTAEMLREAELDQGPPEEVPCVRVYSQAQNRKTVIVGNILTGVGGAAFAASAVMFSLGYDRLQARDSIVPDIDTGRIEELERQQRGFVIAGLISGLSSAALLSSGLPVMALGYRRERTRQGVVLDVPAVSMLRNRHHSGATSTHVDVRLSLRF